MESKGLSPVDTGPLTPRSGERAVSVAHHRFLCERRRFLWKRFGSGRPQQICAAHRSRHGSERHVAADGSSCCAFKQEVARSSRAPPIHTDQLPPPPALTGAAWANRPEALAAADDPPRTTRASGRTPRHPSGELAPRPDAVPSHRSGQATAQGGSTDRSHARYPNSIRITSSSAVTLTRIGSPRSSPWRTAFVTSSLTRSCASVRRASLTKCSEPFRAVRALREAAPASARWGSSNARRAASLAAIRRSLPALVSPQQPIPGPLSTRLPSHRRTTCLGTCYCSGSSLCAAVADSCCSLRTRLRRELTTG